MFSRNSASSRAIPFNKMVEMVRTDPFIPIAWQKDLKGMQGTEYITDERAIVNLRNQWTEASSKVIKSAKGLNRGAYVLEVSKDEDGHNMRDFHSIELEDTGVTKQLCNRLLEPFMWHTVLVTATEFENFFELRCPKYHYKNEEFLSRKNCINSYTFIKGFEEDIAYLKSLSDLDWVKINTSQAEIHMQALAEAMWDAMNGSVPNQLQTGEWHIPFGDKFDESKLLSKEVYGYSNSSSPEEESGWLLEGGEDAYYKKVESLKIQIATARAARLSYMTFDGEINYQKDIELHDILLKSKHASPFEHCSRVLTESEYKKSVKTIVNSKGELIFEAGWVDNFKGFISYRRILNI